MVRSGQDLKSTAIEERLATGSIVEELALKGERLQYKLVTGNGPSTGWISLKVGGKSILIKKDGKSDPNETPMGPGSDAGGVEVDESLKKKIEDMAVEKKEKALFPLYVMKYKALGYPLDAPKLRILCFHNAGSTESNYTGAKTPFTNWAKETGSIEICAFDYPGRDKLLKEQKHESIETLAPDLLAVFHEKMTDNVPYIVWGHSVGTWVAFEFLMLARKMGLPMPIAGFFNAFPAPHMAVSKRNWHKNRSMNEEAFKKELINWDKDHFTGAGKIVFDMPAWNDLWMPLMRADFCLFDEYVFKHDGAPKFSFPIHAWHFDGEHYNEAYQVNLWKDWTTGEFDHKVMKGMGHLTCVYKPDMKKDYFENVVECMKKHSGL